MCTARYGCMLAACVYILWGAGSVPRGFAAEEFFSDRLLAGDKGYRADWIDACLMALGISPVIPSKSNEDRDARPVPFNGEAYRKRNIIERVIGWIKENRRVFSRFEKTAKNFGGMIKMAFIRSYLKQ